MSEGGKSHKKNQDKGVANFPPLPSDAGKARDQAAKAVGVSGKSVDHATRVLKSGNPELIAAVDAASG